MSGFQGLGVGQGLTVHGYKGSFEENENARKILYDDGCTTC